MSQLKIWLRKEDKANERRSPLSPKDAEKLIKQNVLIVCESSSTRVFSDEEYQKVGCQITQDSWSQAPNDYFILGLKELDVNDTTSFSHNHIYFAHSYKGQEKAEATLQSFQRGNGQLFDLEYLTNEQGKRIAAFGMWAGFVGMSIAIDYFYHRQLSQSPYPELKSFENQDLLISSILDKKEKSSIHPKIIIIGASGRCGHGANKAASLCSLEPTLWDSRETKNGGPFSEINNHDIFINCALITKKIKPFINKESLQKPLRRLSVIADVGCDPNSDLNPLPIYNDYTSWEKPFDSISDLNVNMMSIDNLPSLLPLESSLDFSEQLVPYLENLIQKKPEDSIVWKNALESFQEALKKN